MEGSHNTAFTWFTEFQLHSVIKNGIVPEWFHGIISRKTAEELLLPKPPGYFLIRLSESRIGYTLSYRAEDRCRHFMIDALKDGHYIIVGETTRHRFLQDLVDFHRRTPIMPFNERLTVPCGQISTDKTDYAELLFTQRQPMNSNTSPNKNILPALPYRPTTLRDSAVPSPIVTKTPAVFNSQPNRLYPSLDDELSHFSSNNPAMLDSVKPVPLPRKRYIANPTQPDQPPDIPARITLPPQNQNQNQVYTRTSSAHESSSASTTVFTTERIVIQSTVQEDSHNSNSQSGRNQDMKPSVGINLMKLKKKFQKKRSTSQEHMYAEIRGEAEERQEGKPAGLEERDRDGYTENEYQELSGEHTINGVPSRTTDSTMKLTDSGLPWEYLPPPPFAPGY
ncbi:hematopoietic SH2 domain-containing protein homolog [Polymixia lowei]